MHDLLPKAAHAGALLKTRRETIAVSESSTGGLVSAVLLAVPGASAYFQGGTIVYTQTARLALLGIGAAEMTGLRSASEPYAELLARTVRGRFSTTWGLAETGAAGPSGNRYGDAAGHVCLAIGGPWSRVLTLETASPDRIGNMRVFAAAALDLLIEALEQAPRMETPA
jgi:nicotinamide-nucleotide amidase